MSHTCHAEGCHTAVAPKMLMCPRHWFSLRVKTRAAIWREYRSGQEMDKKPSVRYLAVQRFAVSEAAFQPNDEAAANLSAKFLRQALVYQDVAIAAGLGDPLEGLVIRKPL